jgi:Flp pilus assembly protein TadG
MKFLRHESGQLLVLVVVCLGMLMAFMALAIDVGQLLYARRQLQTAADEAALAGALEIQQCGTTSNCTAMQTAAKSAFTENGLGSPGFATQCAKPSVAGLALVLNNGPCELGTADPDNNNASYVEAVVSMPQQTLFANLMGFKTITVAARSEAGLSSPQFCVDVTSPATSQALLMNSNSSLVASCGVMVDSNSGTAFLINSNATLRATAINVHGGDLINGSPSLTPSTPSTGVAAMADPLTNTPAPTLGSCGATTSSPYAGSPTQVTVNGSATLTPGTYCGGIQANAGATIMFTPGTYVMEGNMVFNSGDTVSGSGTTFYFSVGSLTMNGSSHANLVAPTTGAYAGILIFENPSDSTSMILNGDSTSVWQGAIYLPQAQLTLNGGSNLAAYTILDVSTLIVNSGNSFTIGADYSSLPRGAPGVGTNAILIE